MKLKQTLAQLYEADETAWLERMAKLIKQGRRKELDYDNLSEYLQDMAIRDRREVQSRLTSLLTHLLKWEHQPRKQTRSWQTTILNQRYELGILLESKTLRRHAEEILPRAYAQAVKEAASETGLAKQVFPGECPYTLDALLADE